MLSAHLSYAVLVLDGPVIFYTEIISLAYVVSTLIYPTSALI